jgi:hypothetical protein
MSEYTAVYDFENTRTLRKSAEVEGQVNLETPGGPNYIVFVEWTEYWGEDDTDSWVDEKSIHVATIQEEKTGEELVDEKSDLYKKLSELALDEVNDPKAD